jgi:ssDNA-binding Zn-finger/Zn-ribbon topoisomerase 1
VKRRAKGRRAFYGCSNYPKCTHVVNELPKKEDTAEASSEAP